MLKRCSILSLLCLLVSPAPSMAGKALDDFVNCFKLDQRTSGMNRERFFTVSKTSPIGQTFKTGPDTQAIGRIALGVAYWNGSWQQGESLVLTLWDSPARDQKIGSFAMPWEWRNWEGAVLMYPFDDSPVKPEREYYMELTVEGGDGAITGIYAASGEYPGGVMYTAGLPGQGDIWFETHVRMAWDRDAGYQEYFDQWKLGTPGLEKVREAVQTQDWDTACRELVAFYETRSGLIEPVTPQKKADYDRSYDDLVAGMQIKDEKGQIWDIKPDWNHYATWPLRGGVGLTRGGIRKNLAAGYRNTADEKFAMAWNDMIIKSFRDQPSPLRAGAIPPGSKDIDPAPPAGIMGGSMWGALSIGARMSQDIYYYQSFVQSPNFTTDARCMVFFNAVDMANVLSIYKGGGNWETQIADALLEFGQMHPELKRSEEWFNKGFALLLSNSEETVHADGALREPSINYHGLVTNRFLQLLENARKNSFAVPESFERRVERMLEFIMHLTGPDWKVPPTGDTFGPWGGEDLLKRGADYFGRRDFLWTATHGAEGDAPAGASRAFEQSGWFVMRSSWTPDARYMLIHNGPSRGHGHSDSLQIMLKAWGGDLLIDPGVYVYGTPETVAISRTTAHSTVTVDGRDSLQEAQSSRWDSKPEYDLFDGPNAGFEGTQDIRLRRRVVFLKPDYWIVVDDVLGAGEHTVDSRFVCAPGAAHVDGRRAVFTTAGRGLLLLTPQEDTSSLRIEEGRRPAEQGRLEPVPVVRKSIHAKLPVRLCQVLVPFKGDTPPELEATCTRSGQTTRVEVRGAASNQIDVVTLADDGTVNVDRRGP